MNRSSVVLLLALLVARRAAGDDSAPTLDTAPRLDDEINNPAQHQWKYTGSNELRVEYDSRSAVVNLWAQPALEGTFRLAPEWQTGFRFDMRLQWDAVNADYKMSAELWLTVYGMRFKRGPHRVRLYLINRATVGDEYALINQAEALYAWKFGGKDRVHSLDVSVVGGPEEKFTSSSYGYYAWLRFRASLLLSQAPSQPTLNLPFRVVLRGSGYTPSLKDLSFVFEPSLDIRGYLPGAYLEVFASDGAYIVGALFGRRY